MALLAFQGAGHTHQIGEFKDVVASGLKALKSYQNPDGFFKCDAAHHHRHYAQAQATLAVCEIYGMSGDEEFRPLAQKAIDFALKSQEPMMGGWRYEPRVDSDLSVTGWFTVALKTAELAGMDVPKANEDLITVFLNSVQVDGGNKYKYKPALESTPTMTAEGLLCRQYLGWDKDDKRLIAGLDYVCENTINYEDANVYYWYHATQATYHRGGSHWKKWNSVMAKTVPDAQVRLGKEAGSWSPFLDRWGAHGGRLYVTCLSIYMLETYYRQAPLCETREAQIK